MAFTFVPNLQFTWPVEIDLPNAEGTHTTHKFTGHFEIIDDVDFLSPDTDVASASAAIDAEISKLMQVFKGWEPGDITNIDGSPIEATHASIRQVLGQRPARIGITKAYQEAVTPSKGYRAKN